MDPMFECNAENGVFTMTFRAPKQLLLHPDYQQMVWDECLRRAHAAGHIPIGSILIEEADDQPEVQELVEGETLTARMERFMLARGNRLVLEGFTGQPVDYMRVTAQVQIGASL